MQQGKETEVGTKSSQAGFRKALTVKHGNNLDQGFLQDLFNPKFFALASMETDFAKYVFGTPKKR